MDTSSHQARNPYFDSLPESIQIDKSFTPLLYITTHGLFTTNNNLESAHKRLDMFDALVSMKIIYAVKMGVPNFLPDQVINDIIESFQLYLKKQGDSDYDFEHIHSTMNEFMNPKHVSTYIGNTSNVISDYKLQQCAGHHNLLHYITKDKPTFDKQYTRLKSDILNSSAHPHDNVIGMIYKDKKTHKVVHVNITHLLYTSRITKYRKSNNENRDSVMITMKDIHEFLHSMGISNVNIIDLSCGSTDVTLREARRLFRESLAKGLFLINSKSRSRKTKTKAQKTKRKKKKGKKNKTKKR